MKNWKLLGAVVLVFTPFAAFAQTHWSYADCVEYARQHNISLQKLQLNEQTAEIDLSEAQAQWQPTLDFSTSHNYINSPWAPTDKNTYSGQIGFNAGWSVWDGGQRENNIKRDRLQLEIAKVNFDDAFRTLETDLLQVYLNILYARESINIYREATELSYAQAERARQLMEAGRLSRVDYSQLQSQYEQDRYSLVNAEGTYNTRRMELKKLLQLGIESDIVPDSLNWTDAQVLALLPDISESYRLAVANDLQLRALDLEKESTDLDVDIAKAGRRPRISLQAGVGTGYMAPGASFGDQIKYGMSENVGLTLALPIFDNNKTKSAVARARVQQFTNALDIDQRETDLAQTIENWYIDTRSAQARFSAAITQLEAAGLANTLTTEQFKLGLVNPVDLMMAHNDYVSARHTLLQAKYMAMLGQKMIEYYRTTKVTL